MFITLLEHYSWKQKEIAFHHCVWKQHSSAVQLNMTHMLPSVWKEVNPCPTDETRFHFTDVIRCSFIQPHLSDPLLTHQNKCIIRFLQGAKLTISICVKVAEWNNKVLKKDFASKIKSIHSC